MESKTLPTKIPIVRKISSIFLSRTFLIPKTLPVMLILILSAFLASNSSALASDGMSLYLQMEEGGSTTFSERLTIQDNGSMDQDQSDDSIDFDVTWGMYQVEGKFEQDTSNVFNMKLSDCTVTRIAPGSPRNERLLITLLSGHYGPNGGSLIFVSKAHVEGQGNGAGHMEVSSSYQVWGPSNNGKFSNLGYTTKPEGQNPWNFDANLGAETFTGPLNYTAGYVNVLVSDVGDSMDLKNSFEVELRDRNENESERGVVPGPIRRWTRALGGNGHCYQAVAAENGIDWFTAEVYSEEILGGYLATITSEGENEFVFRLIDSPKYWTNLFEGSGSSWGPWLGGSQAPWGSEPDVGWQWVTGEGSSYGAWAEGQPDNETPDEDHLHFFAASNETRSPHWNDVSGSELLLGFVAECEGPPNNLIEGDINEDGVVDIEDFDQWQAYKNNIERGLKSEQRWFDPYMIIKGDVDGDNVISENDYNNLHKTVFGVEPFVIDTFDTSLPPFTVADQDGTFPQSEGTSVTDSMLGGVFDVVVTLKDAGTPFDSATVEIVDGHLCFRQDPTSTGEAICHWDGVQSPFEVTASEGLGGGVDISDKNGIALDVLRNDEPLEVAVVVLSSVDDSSELNLNIPVITEPTTVTYNFDDFSKNGNGMNPEKVTAVVLYIGPGGVTGPAHLEIDRIIATSPLPVDDGPDVLYDQIDQLPSSAIWSVDFPGDNPWDAQAADDFTVPPDQNWSIQKIKWAAEWIPFAPPDPTAKITIFENADGVPGDPLFTESNVPILPADDEDQVWAAHIPEPWELGEGTYWVSCQAEVPIGFEMLIKESSAERGAPYAWRNPGGAFVTSCLDWAPGTDCLGEHPSLAFSILGNDKIEIIP